MARVKDIFSAVKRIFSALDSLLSLFDILVIAIFIVILCVTVPKGVVARFLEREQILIAILFSVCLFFLICAFVYFFRKNRRLALIAALLSLLLTICALFYQTHLAERVHSEEDRGVLEFREKPKAYQVTPPDG
jgi:hypothetical protein